MWVRATSGMDGDTESDCLSPDSAGLRKLSWSKAAERRRAGTNRGVYWVPSSAGLRAEPEGLGGRCKIRLRL